MSSAISARSRLFGALVCPLDRAPLQDCSDHLLCAQGHRFEIEQGIPVFMARPRRELVPGNMAPCPVAQQSAVEPFVNDWIVNTNGNLYWLLRGKLPRYPIPQWPLPPGKGEFVLDIGCSWGRWSVAAGRSGCYPVGVDVHLDALAVASRVARQLGVEADFVCSDAGRLPFASKSVDLVFSYSVLQHLERPTVLGFFAEALRVLKPGGVCFVQLPNRFGLASILQQCKRGFREAKAGTFEMRYWSPHEIRRGLSQSGLAAPRIRADGFLSQNARASDRDLLSSKGKLIVLASETGCRASEIFPFLTNFADSLWIESRSPL